MAGLAGEDLVEHRPQQVDVAAHPDEMDTVLSYNGGRTNIPVVVFPDGSHLTEPSDQDLAAKLAEVNA